MRLNVQSFMRSVFSQGIVQLLLALRTIIAIPIIAKHLDDVSYGVWSQIIITATLLALAFTLRFDVALVRFFSSDNNEDRISTIFNSMLYLILVALGILWVVFSSFENQIAQLVLDGRQFSVYVPLLFALLALRTVQNFALSYYRSQHRIILYSILQSVQLLAEISLLFAYIVLLGNSLLIAVEAVVIFNSILTGVTLISVLKEIGITLPHFRKLAPYLAFSLPLIPNVSLTWLTNFSNRYVIVYFLDLQQVAFFAAAFALGRFVTFFATPIQFVLLPTISKLWEEGKTDEVKKWIVNSVRMFASLGVPALFGIHYFSPQVLEKLASHEYARHTSLVLLIGSGFILSGIYQMYLYLMHLKKETRQMLVIFLIVSLISLVLNVLLVPLWGIEGAGLATLFAYLVQGIMIYIISTRNFKVPFPTVFIVKTFLASGLMYSFLHIWVPPSIITSTIWALAGILIYIGIMIISGAFDRDELEQVFRQVLGR